MFTGLIREIATVKCYVNNILTIQTKHKAEIGDSIAINGICLTVISVHDDGFDLELADETRSIVDESKIVGRVHLEPAMQLNDRFEGHIVQGHIDCTGEVIELNRRQNATDFIIRVDREYINYIIPKGSITIDGVSLTINSVYRDSFRLTIIPHTLKETLIGEYTVGTKVNIETDLFARYIDHILNNRGKREDLSWSEVDAMQLLF